MDWNDVRYFLALARLSSVRAAGKQLGVSHSTVARRVDTLEGQLGARLFDRSQDGYTLTAAGRLLLPGAERVEREIADVERVLVGQDERLAGRVTLTCGESFLADFLIQSLGPFCRSHPEIELKVSTDPRPFDLTRREADVAVRALAVGVSPPELLLGTRVAPVVLANYVARVHAASLDPDQPGSPARWLVMGDDGLSARIVAGSSYPGLPEWGSFGTMEACLSAIRAGLGIVSLPVYVGDADPALQRLTRADLRHMGDFWLLCHPDLRHTARVQAVRGVIARAFVEAAARFRG